MKKFNVEISKATNCCCDICFRLGRVMKVRYYVQDYRSNKRKDKICKTLQKHPRSIWICERCYNDFKSEYIRSTRGSGFRFWDFHGEEDDESNTD